MIFNIMINYKPQVHSFTVRKVDEAARQGPEVVKEWKQRYSEFEKEKAPFWLNLRPRR
jgi:hypothetical protein